MLSYNEFNGEGNGFTFFNYNAHDMLHTIERAEDYYRNQPEIWKKLQKRGMEGDYSWNHSANEYVKLYNSILNGDKHEKQKVHADHTPNPVVIDIP